MAVKGSGNKMIQSGNYLGNISRTKNRNNYDFRVTLSSGYLVPIFAQEIYPSFGESIDCAELVRSITPLGPTMDNAFLDIYFFFVPSRILWDHYEEFIAGYNKEAWKQDVEYLKPRITFKMSEDVIDGNSYVHSFLDYLPGATDVFSLAYAQHKAYLFNQNPDPDVVAKNGTAQEMLNNTFWIDALYPRAYAKIWNDWFRDENLQDELQLYTGDNDEYADEFCFNLLSPLALPKANKLHDRITSALPSPVKGPDVLIPMKDLQVGITSPLNVIPGQFNLKIPAGNVTSGDKFVNAITEINNSTQSVVANNVSNTIRMLRLATQTELLLARDARGGTRFTESIMSHFKVHNGDARLQRSEYLGSRSIPLNVQQVTNMSQADNNALGNVGGQSVTKDSHFYFNQSFGEWGIVLGLATVRTAISRSSGIRKIYQRRGRFDHIWPEFKHVGDIPLLLREYDISNSFIDDIYTGASPDKVFGYTPYGSEFRTGVNLNAGLFRAKASGSLSYLTYQEAQKSNATPVLSSDWIPQDPSIISNTLIDQEGPQYYIYFHITEDLIVPLDPTSDSGMMDHF